MFARGAVKGVRNYASSRLVRRGDNVTYVSLRGQFDIAKNANPHKKRSQTQKVGQLDVGL